MIRVRPAGGDDLPRVLEIARHSATAARWNEAEYRKILSSETNRKLMTLVVQEDERLMGFLIARQVAEDEWEIDNVAVSGDGRRRGLGSRLIGHFLQLVRERGVREVFLEVRESNRAAQALYEKWAFVEAGRRAAYYQDPVEDALVLRFSFPES